MATKTVSVAVALVMGVTASAASLLIAAPAVAQAPQFLQRGAPIQNMYPAPPQTPYVPFPQWQQQQWILPVQPVMPNRSFSCQTFGNITNCY